VEKGIKLLNKLEGVEGLIVVENNAKLKIYKTRNFTLK
jgi:hypothetical protein